VLSSVKRCPRVTFDGAPNLDVRPRVTFDGAPNLDVRPSFDSATRSVATEPFRCAQELWLFKFESDQECPQLCSPTELWVSQAQSCSAAHRTTARRSIASKDELRGAVHDLLLWFNSQDKPAFYRAYWSKSEAERNRGSAEGKDSLSLACSGAGRAKRTVADAQVGGVADGRGRGAETGHAAPPDPRKSQSRAS
jgi:hypothetical protein